MPSSGRFVMFVVSLISLLSFTPASAEERGAGKVVTEGRIQSLLPAFEAYVEKSRREWEVPSAAVAVVFNDRILWWKGFGNRGGGLTGPPDSETVYAIGSTTKAFAAATLAMMVDEKKFDWNSRVVDHVADFQMGDPWVTREMRVADLLAQHPGIPKQALSALGAMGYSREAIVKALRWVKPNSSFRTEFSYVNSLHLVAGDLVARKSGLPSWEAYLKAKILDPLGMSRTTWTAKGLDEDPNRAPGHARIDGQAKPIVAGPFPYVFGPAGGLNSTLADMARWVRMQLSDGSFENNRLVSRENLNVTRTPQTVMNSEAFYCMGWMAFFRSNHRLIWHNGGTPGHTTFVGIQPAHGLGLVVLSNLGDTQMPDAIGLRFFSMVHGSDDTDYSSSFLRRRAEQQKGAAKPQPGETQPPPDAASLTGVYRNPALGEMHVSAKGNEVFLRFSETGVVARLEHLNGAMFRLQFTGGWLADVGWTAGGDVQFTRGSDGSIEGFAVRLGENDEGATFHARRDFKGTGR